MQIEVFNLSNYVLPEIKVMYGTKYILNGDNNSFFKYIKERYIGSPTNSGIINGYVNYIIGEGLIEKSDINIKKYLSKQDLRLICQDFKMYGQFSLQVIWSNPITALKQEASVVLIKHIPTDKIGLNQDKDGNIDGYWYSYDWDNKGRYKPKLYPKFDGTYKEATTELITFSRISSETYFAQPDYVSGLPSARAEEELQNFVINHLLNGFSAGKIINIKGGTPPTDELKAQYVKKIIEKLTGTNGQNNVIVSFSDGIEGGEIEIQNIEPTSLDANFTVFKETSQDFLFASHGVVNPILFGIRDGSGLGSNKDEMKEALKTLYRSNINPMREVIIDGLEFVLRNAEPNIDIDFKDFDELTIKDENNETE